MRFCSPLSQFLSSGGVAQAGGGAVDPPCPVTHPQALTEQGPHRAGEPPTPTILMAHVESLTPGARVRMEPLPAGQAVPGAGARALGHRHHHGVMDVLILDPVDLGYSRQSGDLGWQRLFVFGSRRLDLDYGVSSVSDARSPPAGTGWLLLLRRSEVRTEGRFVPEYLLLQLLVTEVLVIHMMIALIVITFLAPTSGGLMSLWPRGPGGEKHSIAALLALRDAAAASLLLSVLESYFAPDYKLPFFIGRWSTGRMFS